MLERERLGGIGLAAEMRSVSNYVGRVIVKALAQRTKARARPLRELAKLMQQEKRIEESLISRHVRKAAGAWEAAR